MSCNIQKSWRVYPSAKHLSKGPLECQEDLGKERSALLPVAPTEDTALEQQAQVISELHKKLAQRFVYGELKIKLN